MSSYTIEKLETAIKLEIRVEDPHPDKAKQIANTLQGLREDDHLAQPKPRPRGQTPQDSDAEYARLLGSMKRNFQIRQKKQMAVRQNRKTHELTAPPSYQAARAKGIDQELALLDLGSAVPPPPYTKKPHFAPPSAPHCEATPFATPVQLGALVRRASSEVQSVSRAQELYPDAYCNLM